MKGLTIIETEALEKLTSQLSRMEESFKEIAQKLEHATEPWMSFDETLKYIKKKETWLYANKSKLGFSKVGGDIVFSRKKIDEYIESRFYQSGT